MQRPASGLTSKAMQGREQVIMGLLCPGASTVTISVVCPKPLAFIAHMPALPHLQRGSCSSIWLAPLPPQPTASTGKHAFTLPSFPQFFLRNLIPVAQVGNKCPNSFLATATASSVLSPQLCTLLWPHRGDGGKCTAVFEKDSGS